MKKLIVTLCVLFVVSCSSSSPAKRYFQLTSDFSQTEQPASQAVKDFIWIESVNVAPYLNTLGIVYQTNDVEYVTANNNLWASSLSQQITARVVHDLSMLLPGRLVSDKPLSKPVTTLKVFIDSFHGHYAGDALIKGRWIINHNDTMTVKNFNYVIRQSQDGYEDLVKTLSKGWQEEEVDLVKTTKL
ncbi:ABC-type transport auxiliary lipoprotein family protein [Zophobihabitans entericus]|uniref:ABC-type transport auxiliary lipoprotein component domain-containing protein n=1 Tax=Zophobihabitans entericus TaxID=1635327 RepID=A0A6G9ICA9_9GAMM|nr:ABC-type transport auxiliary lipoprotein family protein [Zophobihabitans entericus]QIQ21865.1 hypothetical protein IPMB12_09335 [Zophobihabitans entericus]